MEKLIVSYNRVSKNDGSQDPLMQINALRRMAKADGKKIDKEYIDLKSGKDTDRVQLQELFTSIKKGEVEMVYLYAIDRLSRGGIFKTLEILKFFEDYRVRIKSCKETWLDTTNPGIGQLLVAVIAWAASYEREKLIERVNEKLGQVQEEIKTNGQYKTRKGKIIKSLGRPSGKKDSVIRNNSRYLARWRRERELIEA